MEDPHRTRLIGSAIGIGRYWFRRSAPKLAIGASLVICSNHCMGVGSLVRAHQTYFVQSAGPSNESKPDISRLRLAREHLKDNYYLIHQFNFCDNWVAATCPISMGERKQLWLSLKCVSLYYNEKSSQGSLKKNSESFVLCSFWPAFHRFQNLFHITLHIKDSAEVNNLRMFG